MKQLSKYIQLLCITCVVLLLPFFALAAKPDSFEITIDPASRFKINESVNVNIRAVDKDGDTVLDYENMVIIEFEWNFIDPDSYEIPSDGIYTFTSDDQWEKTFSQALKLKEGWTYTLMVFDTSDETVFGKQVIIVDDTDIEEAQTEWIATIISPLSGETVTTSSVNLLWKTEFVRSPVQVFLNGVQSDIEAETDENGNFNVFLDEISSGNNELFVRIVNIDNELLAESEQIAFGYAPPWSDGVFKSLTISPSNTFEAWVKVKYTVEVWEWVNDVELKIGSLGIFPLDKETPTIFSKEVTIDRIWDQQISATVILQWWERKSYPNVWTVTVKQKEQDVRIQNVKVVRDSLDTTQIQLQRQAIWTPYSYQIRYGENKDNLDQTLTTRETNTIINDLQAGQNYFFQVFGTNEGWATVGFASEIVWSEFFGSATDNGTCSVWGISVSTIRMWNTSYLSRWAVPWATNYTVYRWDSSANDLQKVWDTTDTKYPYPFDPTKETNQFAFYKVEATCSDGQTLQIDGVKQVQVWPEDHMLIVLLVSGLVFGVYRLRRIVD